MIVDIIQSKDQYRSIPKLSKALDYLSILTVDTMPQNPLTVDGGSISILPEKLITLPPTEIPIQAHRSHIYVHYVLAGYEMISAAPLSTLTIKTPYNAQEDIAYYNGKLIFANILQPQCFMICFPGDAYQPYGMLDKPVDLLKVVAKIPIR